MATNIPHPTRIPLRGGSKAYIFTRADPRIEGLVGWESALRDERSAHAPINRGSQAAG